MSKFWIQTFTNMKFDLENPTAEMVCIEDIAHALANTCRFNGHVPEFYSVAQHSVLMSWYIDDPYKFTALMHDTQEAYVGDMVSPLKRLVGDAYRSVEDNVWGVIAQKFNIPFILPKVVKLADLKMLATEKLMFGKEPQSWELDIEPYFDSDGDPIRIRPWTPIEAEREFLVVFEQLTKENGW